MNAKETFLLTMVRGNSIRAALGRARVFRHDAGKAERRAFRQDFHRILIEVTTNYRTRVPVRVHEHNLTRIARRLSLQHSDILRRGELRLGIVQKAFNLYLKYLWCLGKIVRPPHCPFDRQVIVATAARGRIRAWTKISTLREYRQLVADAEDGRRRCGFRSVAEWELKIYNRKLEMED